MSLTIERELQDKVVVTETRSASRDPRRGMALAVLGVAVLLAIGSATRPRNVRIMTLGDSVTYGVVDASPNHDSIGGYRKHLYQLLTSVYQPVTFVGTKSIIENPGIKSPWSANEGHRAWTTLQMLGHVADWTREDRPDIILVMAGVNDMHHGMIPARVAARLKILLENATEAAPNAKVYVCSLPPTTAVDVRRAAPSEMEAYSELIPGVADNLKTQGRNVTFVDMHRAGITSNEIGSSGVHLTQAGYDKMAEVWFSAIRR